MAEAAHIIVLGLPSEGLQALCAGLALRHLEDEEIRRAHDHPDEPRGATREWMAERIARQQQAAGEAGALLVYQAPWKFLARQIRKSADAPSAEPQLVAFTRDALDFWRAYHEALLGLRQRTEARCVLLNADRALETAAVLALVGERFGAPPAAGRDAPAARPFPGAHEESYWQAVHKLSPACLELYAALESRAELMGRRPEAGFGQFPARQGSLADLLRAELKSLSPRHEADLYRAQLAQVQEELARQAEINRQQRWQIDELARRADGPFRPVLRRLGRVAGGLRRYAVKLGAAVPLARRLGQARRNRALRAQAERIRKSGLFDEAWYLRKYPDVARARIDPVEHYLRFGVGDGRDPSAQFNTRWYLTAYTDVAASGANPLLHYIEFGRREGRRPARAAPAAGSEARAPRPARPAIAAGEEM